MVDCKININKINTKIHIHTLFLTHVYQTKLYVFFMNF